MDYTELVHLIRQGKTVIIAARGGGKHRLLVKLREEFADKPYGSHCEATERFIEGHSQWNQFQETISRKNQ